MFGMMEALLSFLRRQVGLRTDVADAAGSLHAKVAEELARVGTINPTSGGTDTLFKYLRRLENRQITGRRPRLTPAVSPSTSYSNLLSISGSGYLIGLYSVFYYAGNTIFEVTIDSDRKSVV